MPTFVKTKKKPFNVIYDLYKMKQLQRKQNWTAKSTNLEENARNIKSVFEASKQPCEPKSFDVALKIAGVKKGTLGKLVVVVNLEAIWFEFWMKGA